MQHLRSFGWDDGWQAAWDKAAPDDCVPARVTADFGTMQRVALPDARSATLSGLLQHRRQPEDLPKVGDWVALRLNEGQAAADTIEAILPRRNEIARKVAGRRAQKQVMAANVDIAFIIQSLDDDFSPERLQRYLYQLTGQDITPIILLNKSDIAADPRPQLEAVATLGVRAIVCSATTGDGVDEIRDAIAPGATIVLLGSSGVGKSTLTNRLIGRETQETREVRASDSTGQHTTTHRELFVLPEGGLLIDTPGIRELQLWGEEEDLNETFEDILSLAAGCKFRNCRHGDEAGCRIRPALRDGTLSKRHYANYLKLRGELRQLGTRSATQDAIQKKKARTKMYKQADRDMRGDSEYPV